MIRCNLKRASATTHRWRAEKDDCIKQNPAYGMLKLSPGSSVEEHCPAKAKVTGSNPVRDVKYEHIRASQWLGNPAPTRLK